MLRFPFLISFQRNPRPLINKSRPVVSSILSAVAFSITSSTPIQKMGIHSNVVVIGSGKKAFLGSLNSFLTDKIRSSGTYGGNLSGTRRTQARSIRGFPCKRNCSRWTTHDDNGCRKFSWISRRNYGA